MKINKKFKLISLMLAVIMLLAVMPVLAIDDIASESFAKLEQLLPIGEWDFIDLTISASCSHPSNLWDVFMHDHQLVDRNGGLGRGCTYTIGYRCRCGHIVSSGPGSSIPCPGPGNRHW